MSHSIQIFVYKTGILITQENNFPILRFETKEMAYGFIQNLKSQPRCILQEPYFVVNNMQLIPNNVRELHQYKKYITPQRSDCFERGDCFESDDKNVEVAVTQQQKVIEDCDSDIEQDDNENKYMMCDGCFSIYENLELLMSCVISNNTNKDVGFKEYLENVYNESQPDEDDLREMYYEQKKYNREDSD